MHASSPPLEPCDLFDPVELMKQESMGDGDADYFSLFNTATFSLEGITDFFDVK